MFEVGKGYRINLKNGRYYNGVILDEDEFFVKIKDKYDVVIGIQKSEISRFDLKVQDNE